MRMASGQFGFVSAPFGYRLKDGTLLPLPEEVKVVRKIFDYYLSGLGIGKIAMELNSQNAIGSPWVMGKVRYILSNEKYIGDSIELFITYLILPISVFLKPEREL